MSTITTRVAELPALAQHFARSRPYLTLTAATATAIAVAAAPLATYVTDTYASFLAIGRGGVPYNIFGWLFQASLRPFARRDLRDPEPLADRSLDAWFAPHGRTSFLVRAGTDDPPLPERRGSRPELPGLILPQRQTSDMAGATLVARMNAHLADVAAQRSSALIVRASGLEHSDCPALWIRPEGGDVPVPSFIKKGTKGEIVHVHPEGSCHMVLSLADAEDAHRKGWAQRHAFSGFRDLLPMSYMMVYAPRDDDEFAVWKRLVAASVDFTTASRG